jgi:hypothetical protein
LSTCISAQKKNPDRRSPIEVSIALVRPDAHDAGGGRDKLGPYDASTHEGDSSFQPLENLSYLALTLPPRLGIADGLGPNRAKS